MNNNEDKTIENDNGEIKNEKKPKTKSEKLEKAKKDLLSSLSGGDFSKKQTKVAHILNLYPDSRNSDVTLTLKYWETFEGNIYNENGIKPSDLFKLERMHYIVRARQKIQNEFKLFTASEEIQRFRKKHEDTMKGEIITDSKPRKVIHVYADETGKTQKYVIVSSVWVLAGKAVWDISQAISEWKKTSRWATREVHFARMGKQDQDTLTEYLGVILQNREYLSFKSIIVERARTSRGVEDVVEKLHELMLIKGVEHELTTNRVSLPQTIEVTLDYEHSLDVFTLNELKSRINDNYAIHYGDQLKMISIDAISSKKSDLVQLSDLIAGAINRKLNHTGELNHKDKMAEMVIQMLDIQYESNENLDYDDSTIFKV